MTKVDKIHYKPGQSNCDVIKGHFKLLNATFDFTITAGAEKVFSDDISIDAIKSGGADGLHQVQNFELMSQFSSALPGHIEQYFLNIFLNGDLIAVSSLQKVNFRFNSFVGNTSKSKTKNNLLKLSAGIVGPVFNGDIWVLGHIMLTGFKYYWVSKDVILQSKNPLSFLASALEKIPESLPGTGELVCLGIMEVNRNPESPPSGILPFKLPPDWNPYSIDPVMKLDIDFKWEGFDDYFSSMRSRYRKKGRAVFKNSNSLEIREFNSEEIEFFKGDIYSLLDQLLERTIFNMIKPDPDFFSACKKVLGENYIFKGVFLEGKMVGFYSAIITGQVMEGHFLGYGNTKNDEYDIYKFMLYALVSTAINSRCRELYLGRTASIAKTNIGAIPLNSSIWIKPVKKRVHHLLPFFYRLFYQGELPEKRSTFK